MNRRLFLKTSAGLAGWLAVSRYSFGNNLRRVRKFTVTLPGLGPDGANEIGNYLPVLSPDTTTFQGTDYYDIVASQFTQTLHTVLSENSIEPSRGSVIVAEESAQARAAQDGTANGTVHTRWGEAFRRNQPIIKALVIPFLVVMCHERGERSAQVGFSEDDDPIEAFLLDGPDETLRVRIAVERLKRRLHDPDADIGQGPAERRAPFGIPIARRSRSGDG